MRTLSFMMVAAVFAAVAPVTAEGSSPTAPCAASSEYANVGLSGAHEDVNPAVMPGYPRYPWVDNEAYAEESIVRFKYRIDVSRSAAAPSATAADVRIGLSWDNISDYDLYVYDANGERLGASNNGPFALPPDVSGTETMYLPQVTHCSDLVVEIVNAIGLPPDEMTLDTALGGVA